MSELTGRGKQFYVELVFALLVTGLASCCAFSNLLFMSENLYPAATDLLGHMAKVQYIAGAVAQGTLPAWFPAWYSGTSMVQYYPPLSYGILVPIYLAVKNVMITYKIFCFSILFIGGMGCWFFCRKHIGKWCGLFGTITFCLQAYIVLTLFREGQVAQGPLIAMLPWYLASMFSLAKKTEKKNFAFCVVCCLLMILSHPNTMFMYCICIMTAFFVLTILGRIKSVAFLFVCLTVFLAGALSAFWSLPGVTNLENPLIPYVLTESVAPFTAKINWFLTKENNLYFALPVLVAVIIAAITYAYHVAVKHLDKEKGDQILFCIIITGFSVLFSFGLQVPFFEYIPMAESMFAGRILSLTSVTAAILCGYLVYGIWLLSFNKGGATRAVNRLVCFAIIGGISFMLNPFSVEYGAITSAEFDEMLGEKRPIIDSFERGRYFMIGPFDSRQMYFPLEYGLNSAEGFNMEGTVHHEAIRKHITANAAGRMDYIAKNLAFWNVRYVILSESYFGTEDILESKMDFMDRRNYNGYDFLKSKKKPTYFLEDKRNTLLLGAGSPGVGIEFPYLVQGNSDSIFDYSLKELEGYRLVYLCEPQILTLKEKQQTEQRIRALCNKGIDVIVEPTATAKYDLFGVTACDLKLENDPLIVKVSDTQLTTEVDEISVEVEVNYARDLFGLDNSDFKLIQNDGRLENDVIGTKKVGQGEVLFLGMHLSQFLKPVYMRNWGLQENSGYPACSEEVEQLFEDVFESYGVEKDFWPEVFPVKKADWDYKGGTFTYSIEDPREITLSVTYTPRWKATVDGKPLEVGQRENLIRLKLPAGQHEIKLTYGVTKYGIAGYVTSLLAVFAFALLIRYYSIIYQRVELLYRRFLSFLQIEDKA